MKLTCIRFAVGGTALWGCCDTTDFGGELCTHQHNNIYGTIYNVQIKVYPNTKSKRFRHNPRSDAIFIQ